jgi:hypothetical protein
MQGTEIKYVDDASAKEWLQMCDSGYESGNTSNLPLSSSFTHAGQQKCQLATLSLKEEFEERRVYHP